MIIIHNHRQCCEALPNFLSASEGREKWILIIKKNLSAKRSAISRKSLKPCLRRRPDVAEFVSLCQIVCGFCFFPVGVCFVTSLVSSYTLQHLNVVTAILLRLFHSNESNDLLSTHLSKIPFAQKKKGNIVLERCSVRTRFIRLFLFFHHPLTYCQELLRIVHCPSRVFRSYFSSGIQWILSMVTIFYDNPLRFFLFLKNK